jgi:hypothetical protein
MHIGSETDCPDQIARSDKRKTQLESPVGREVAAMLAAHATVAFALANRAEGLRAAVGGRAGTRPSQVRSCLPINGRVAIGPIGSADQSLVESALLVDSAAARTQAAEPTRFVEEARAFLRPLR